MCTCQVAHPILDKPRMSDVIGLVTINRCYTALSERLLLVMLVFVTLR